MSPPLVIPVFITHQGCPHRCVFCNQQPITGSPEQAPELQTAEAVRTEIRRWLERSPRRGRRVQVAFYGGSFTGLSPDRQQELLTAVQPFIASGEVDGIRLSTRPDYIHPETPAFLRRFGVETVEVGIQSMEQTVLDQSLRGHSVRQAEEAIAILKGAGLRTGAQMMVGLPGETTGSALRGAKRLAGLAPDFARLYPALVIRGSGLDTLYRSGRYLPLSLPRAVALTARLTAILAGHGIPVVRTGLQPSVELEANLVAGPYHPAFGELVKARGFFKEVRRELRRYQGQPCRLLLAERDRSLFSGQKRCSLQRLQELGLMAQTTILYTAAPGHRGRVQVEGVDQPIAFR